jgi:hypothetical protein
MKIVKVFSGILLLAAMACLPARADTISLSAPGNDLNSGNFEWDNPGYAVCVNVFPTSMLDGNAINQLDVAWGNQTGPATVALLSIANDYYLPHHGAAAVDSSQLTVLQTVTPSVSVSNAQTNLYLSYPTGSYPSNHYLVPGDTPTYSTYSIPATAITTNYFAVETIMYTPNPFSYITSVSDIATDLPHDGSAGYSWFGFSGGSIGTDLTGVGTGGLDYSNSPGWVEDWPGYGYGNNPFLIDVGTQAVPEPGTLVLLAAGLAGFALAGVRARQRAA